MLIIEQKNKKYTFYCAVEFCYLAWAVGSVHCCCEQWGGLKRKNQCHFLFN